MGKGMLWKREMTKQGTTAEYETYLNTRRLLTRNTATKWREFQATDIKCLRKIKGNQKGTELETQFYRSGNFIYMIGRDIITIVSPSKNTLNR
jgi:hypothetical protein